MPAVCRNPVYAIPATTGADVNRACNAAELMQIIRVHARIINIIAIYSPAPLVAYRQVNRNTGLKP